MTLVVAATRTGINEGQLPPRRRRPYGQLAKELANHYGIVLQPAKKARTSLTRYELLMKAKDGPWSCQENQTKAVCRFAIKDHTPMPKDASRWLRRR